MTEMKKRIVQSEKAPAAYRALFTSGQIWRYPSLIRAVTN